MQQQMSMFDPDSQFGKMFPELSAVTKAKTSERSSKRSVKLQTPMFQYLNVRNGNTRGVSWEMVTALPGESMTLNFGESPSGARESTLSQILEANAPEKYYLSPKACAGIIRRAERRGKELPTILKEALEEAVALGV